MSPPAAGRALDALIAEKVMGLDISEHIAPDHDWGDNIPFEDNDHPSIYCRRCHEGGCVLCRFGDLDMRESGPCRWTPYLLAYSSDIGAAWQVVEKMRETHWAKVEGIGRPEQRWRAMFRLVDEPYYESVNTASTAPLAICLCALKAVAGLGVPEQETGKP